MKAILVVKVNKPDPLSKYLTVEDYKLAVLNIRGKSIDDISHKASRIADKLVRDAGGKYTGTTCYYDKEVPGIGFAKFSYKNGLTGKFSVSKEDFDLAETIGRA